MLSLPHSGDIRANKVKSSELCKVLLRSNTLKTVNSEGLLYKLKQEPFRYKTYNFHNELQVYLEDIIAYFLALNIRIIHG